MFRRLLFPAVGALALLVALGAPAQVHAQRMRGGFSTRFMPGFRRGPMPGFPGGRMPGFRRGLMPGSRSAFERRLDRFEDRFNRGFDRRFDRFEDRFNRGFFDRR